MYYNFLSLFYLNNIQGSRKTNSTQFLNMYLNFSPKQLVIQKKLNKRTDVIIVDLQLLYTTFFNSVGYWLIDWFFKPLWSLRLKRIEKWFRIGFEFIRIGAKDSKGLKVVENDFRLRTRIETEFQSAWGKFGLVSDSFGLIWIEIVQNGLEGI